MNLTARMTTRPDGPANADTDGDGLADGSELVVKSVRTANRTPVPDLQGTGSDPMVLAPSGPAWALASATLMMGFTHPDMGDVTAEVVDTAPSPYGRYVPLRDYENAGEANNFTSYDLVSLGCPRDELAYGGPWSVYAYDRAAGRTGQTEYAQIQVTRHTLPNRADTDGDGLNDSEEVNLGADGYATNPWLADTDADGVTDGLEANGWSWSGSTISSNPSGFKTDPTRADTDHDGVSDGRDYVPTGDAFVQVTLTSIVVRGTGASDGDTTFQPFGSITVGTETSYSAWVDAAPGVAASLDHQYTVNVDDATPTVDITIRAWDDDTRVENGHPDDVHTSLAVATDTSYGGCSGMPSWTFTYALWTALPPLTSNGTCSGATYLRADPITVTVTTVVPPRVDALLVVPRDYSGIVNVTDSGGTIVSRRYVGEPRFVPILVNVTGVVSFAPKVILVPRSVFFDTQLYHLLATQDIAGLPSDLSFRQNDTSATSNSDALQATIQFRS